MRGDLSSTVEFLPFGLDWTHVAEVRFSENKDLLDNNDPPRRQKVRNSTVELRRYTVKGCRASYMLVIQHHEIPSARVLIVPVTLPVRGDVDALAPPLMTDGVLHRARLLDIGAIPRPQIRS